MKEGGRALSMYKSRGRGRILNVDALALLLRGWDARALVVTNNFVSAATRHVLQTDMASQHECPRLYLV